MSIAINRVDRFYELVKKPERKKRKCIKCAREFISNSITHRYCCDCRLVVNEMGTRAESVIFDCKGA